MTANINGCINLLLENVMFIKLYGTYLYGKAALISIIVTCNTVADQGWLVCVWINKCNNACNECYEQLCK